MTECAGVTGSTPARDLGETCRGAAVDSVSAVLGGELAVPCTRDPLHAGLNPRLRPSRSEAARGAGR
jgi:hypothetical protein